jgi:hypothetical protein
MEQESIDELKQFEEEVASAMADEPEPETVPEPGDVDDTVDWKKRCEALRLKNEELVAVIEKSFEMIRYMGDTVLKMGFTFDQINDMFTSN